MSYTAAVQLKVFDSLSKITPEQWRAVEAPSFPFTDYAYLRALETGEAVGGASGWIPHYFTLWEESALIAAAMIYEKYNSYGEYIFDWEWARAYQANGISYYPKLVGAVPFTPATGPKLLFAPGRGQAELATALIRAVLAFRDERHCSSSHFLFLDEREVASFEQNGFLIRHTHQFHWHNEGYRSFDEFLSNLKGRKAKQIRREREQLLAENLDIVRLTGADLTLAHAEQMYAFYASTIEKMGAIEYLSEEFFRCVFATMADNLVVWFARRDEVPVAGAIHYLKGESLFGRYWGCSEEVRNLHFELCYYRAIEFAIERGLKRVEAGAQGEHKVARGFVPSMTYSAHHFRHPAFQRAIGQYLMQEREALARGIAEFEPHSPFRVV